FPTFVLAPRYLRGRELRSRVGIAQRVRPADINASILPGENPVAHVERLAMEKAVAVSALPEVDADTVVLAADTIVVVDGAILGKPADSADASEMLRRLDSRSHTVHTALSMVRAQRSALTVG